MVIVFDVMGTLLDPAPLAPLVKHASGGRMNVRHFFGEVTTYAMANTLSGASPSFEDVASSVLHMVAAGHGRELSEGDLASFRKKLASMPAFPDVKDALSRLQERGLRLAALSNANTELLERQLKRAKLSDFFEEIISVDSLGGSFKPARSVYEAALARLGGHSNEMLMVAAHSWDLLGAARGGYRTALINRGSKAAYPDAPEPSHIATDLEDFTDQLLGPSSKRGIGTGWLLATAGVALGLGVAGTTGWCESCRIPGVKAKTAGQG